MKGSRGSFFNVRKYDENGSTFPFFRRFFPRFFFLFFFVSRKRKLACHACNGTSNNLISLPVGEILRSRGVEEILFKNSSLSLSEAKSKGLTHLLLQSFVAYFHIRVHTMHIHAYLARLSNDHLCQPSYFPFWLVTFVYTEFVITYARSSFLFSPFDDRRKD